MKRILLSAATFLIVGTALGMNDHEKNAYYTMASTYKVQAAVDSELDFIRNVGYAFQARKMTDQHKYFNSALSSLRNALNSLKTEYAAQDLERNRLSALIAKPFTTKYWKTEFYKGLQNTFAKIAILGSEIHRVENIIKSFDSITKEAKESLAAEIAERQSRIQQFRTAGQPSTGTVVVVPPTKR